MTVLENIKKARKSKDISQKEMADRLKISISTYQKIEQGHILLNIDRFLEICQILEIKSYNKLLPSVNAETVFKIESVVNGNYKALSEIEGFSLNAKRLIDELIEKIQNNKIEKKALLEELEFLNNYMALIKRNSHKESYETFTIDKIIEDID